MEMKYKNLFTPLVVGGQVFKNRIFGGPHYTGIPYTPPGNETSFSMLAAEAKGGIAKVTVSGSAIDDKYGRPSFVPFCFDRSTAAYFSECAQAIKQYGAMAFIELCHNGQFGASETPIGPCELTRPDGVHVKAMDEVLMQHVIDCYVNASVLAKQIGFNGIMIHGGHGWLFTQFASPYFNHRTDEYGGSMENRARFPQRVVQAIREAVGRNFLVEYRVSGDEHVEGGMKPEEVGEFLQYLEEYVDMFNISGGLECFKFGTVYTSPGIFQPHGINVEAAGIIKKMVRKPISVVGAITDPAQAEEIIASGKADAVMVMRAICADPDFANKARAGLDEDIVPCTRCLNCFGESESFHTFACSANPTFLRTYRLNHEYSEKPKSRKVLVIGGGVAGMKAAITACDRGHSVTLVEKSDRLGGIINFTDHDEIKVDLNRHKNYLVRQVEKRPIRVVLNREFTPDDLGFIRPEAIIVATGSRPIVPSIPGIDLPNVQHVVDMYENREKLGCRIVLIGGGMSGCETAMELGRAGHHVTVLESLKGFAREAHRMASLGLMEENRLNPNVFGWDCTEVTEIMPDGVMAKNKDGTEIFYPADNVLYAVGMKPVNDLCISLAAAAPYVAFAGDCISPRRTMEAIREGYFAAMNIM